MTSGSVWTLKPSQFIFHSQNQVNFDPNTDVKSNSIPTLGTSNICMPPDTKTQLISIQALNHVIFDPPTKQNQCRSLQWNPGGPHRNQVYFYHPHNNQVNFDANT